MTGERPIALVGTGVDADTELARAEAYGLLAALWFAPPDEALRQRFAVATTEAAQPGSFLEAPWQALVAAMRATPVAQAAAEYDALFLGVGKPELFLYGSYYASGFLNETPLVQLRDDLARLGLERSDPQRGETEDHVASVCDVMRYLIAGGDPAVCNLEQQQRFFRVHVQPWVERLCDAVQAHPRAALYAALAGFTRGFVQVETQAFDMLE